MEKRFNDFIYFQLKANDAILAAVSHSYFKLRWILKEKKNYVQNLFFLEVEKHNEYINIVDNTNVNTSISSITTRNDFVSESFFSFQTEDDKDINKLKTNTMQLQCMKYFQDKDVIVQYLWTAIQTS